MTLYRNFDLMLINRSTYDLLQFLGDVGGLDSVLKIFGVLIVAGIQKLKMKTYVVANLYFQSTLTEKNTNLDDIGQPATFLNNMQLTALK